MLPVILHLRAAVEQLYSAAPAQFTALRGELVKQARTAGEKQLAASVGRLRKPTVAAWALNHFVRTHPEGLDELRSFAALMREAQRTLNADQLRALGRERSDRVEQASAAVAALADEQGHPLGAAVQQEVRDTLVAVIADEAAEASVRSGALVRALSYSGFGEVDLDDVIALGGLAGEGRGETEPSADRPELEVLQGGGHAVDLDDRRATRRAEKRERLTGALDTARSALRTAERQVAVQTARHEEVTEGIADLERRLATARNRLEKVAGELDEVTAIRDTAERAERDAQRALDTLDQSS